LKEKGQDLVMSYALQQTADKISAWFPKKDVLIWNGKLKNAIYLWVYGMEDSKGHNRMEILRVKKEGKNGEMEMQVPVPRLVDLRFSVIPAFTDTTEALNCSARLIRNTTDDPFVAIEEFNWHGNDEGRTMLESAGGSENIPVPEELAPFIPFRRDYKMTIGINSGKEEKITRVQKRQFTAVKK
jgi:hypothetical protein